MQYYNIIRYAVSSAELRKLIPTYLHTRFISNCLTPGQKNDVKSSFFVSSQSHSGHGHWSILYFRF